MSLIDQARGKKTLIIALIAACAAVIVLIAVFMPSVVKKPEVTEEVISKRAKIEPQAPEQAMPPAAPQPGTAARVPAAQAPAVTAGAKQPAVKPEPEAAKEPAKVKAAEKAVKRETVTEKPKKTVKSEKASPESGRTKAKEKAASSRLVAAKSRPWAVNIASYSDEASAKKLAASLMSAGYNAYTTEGRKSGKTWHRVRVGFYRTRADAEKAGGTIEKKFNIPSTWVVKPARNETAGHINR
ncbi:MAG: SPOR domain-containing protein [Deltaproteobacteria bacterium]|nr:SPOR domain-containing protein [Deltaproteobacteria bacterium]